MVFPIAGGNESKGYEISNSLRFNKSDNADIDFTFGETTNRQKFTFSFWLKRGIISSAMKIVDVGTASSDTGRFVLELDGSDDLRIEGGASTYRLTDQKFRDPSAWYHFVVAFDTSDGTQADRIKFYLNGTQVTSFSTNAIDQNQNTPVNENAKTITIGKQGPDNNKSGDFYLADFYFIDSQQYDPTYFGEFDDNGVWIPKKYTGTFGNNGFKLEFQQTGTSANSSGIGADTSGNDNHFTPSNLAATDITEDTPTNNFATLNPLKTTSTSANLSEGNTKFSITANSAGSERNAFATITFPNSGKWYMETKVTHSALSSDSGNQAYVGVLENPDNIDHLTTSNPNSISTNGIFTDVRIVGTISDAIQHGTNGSATSYNTDPDWSSGDIIGIALDMDNGRVYYHLNGTYYDDASGNVPNPATPANHNHSFTVPSNGLAFFVSVLRYNTSTIAIETNFGNPSYSISSGNTDGKYGNFEYAPPSGYYALCTKRLAEFG